MVTHIEYEEDLLNKVSAGVRAHYDGLFLYGAPDVVVVNMTKDAVWARKAGFRLSGMSRPGRA
jgi:ribonuclease Z